MHLFPIILLLTTTTFPLPTHQQLPPTSKSPTFNILAIIPPDTPLANINAWSLTSSPLSPNTPSSPIFLTPNRANAAIFYENGTEETFAARTSQILTDLNQEEDGGAAAVPWATTLQTPADESSQVNLVKGGKGYPGIQVADWPATVYLGTGTWFVCNVTVSKAEGGADEESVALFWRWKGMKTPEGCSGAELQAWCVEGDEVVHEFGRESTCYVEE